MTSLVGVGPPTAMRAMVLEHPKTPLRLREIPTPRPGPDQVLLRVRTCGVCRTDLHIVDGELPDATLPLVLGHEIVGVVAAVGAGVAHLRPGNRIGVPWLAWTCGRCRYCAAGRENLCDLARFTGYTQNGGYAEYAVADGRFCVRLPERYSDSEGAPLLCAGLIGYRAYRLAGDGVRRLGLYGFGAAAHIIAQVAAHAGLRVYAFTRPGDTDAQALARRLGATWAGASTDSPPEILDAAIIFAPVGGLVPTALRAVVKGGTVVCAGIHMSEIPSFPYRMLWEERVLRSVANLTRDDATAFSALAATTPIRTAVRPFRLEEANDALEALREGRVHGAAVLVIDGPSRG